MGLVKKAADYLASVDIKADTFTDIEANPSVATVEKATAKYLESGADFIVAFGGGSPMDVAKAVGVAAKGCTDAWCLLRVMLMPSPLPHTAMPG